MYIDEYGGSADVGIGKVLYRYTLSFRKVGKNFVSKFIRRRKNKGMCRLVFGVRTGTKKNDKTTSEQ
jgi:hypothetical protein